MASLRARWRGLAAGNTENHRRQYLDPRQGLDTPDIELQKKHDILSFSSENEKEKG